MARKVFFSFHYQRDVWRVSQIRNCNKITNNFYRNDFLDAATWETIKKGGDSAIKNWINNQLKGTSVTIVLIGYETSSRKYAHYEISKSIEKTNGFVGIYINNVRDSKSQTDFRGENPLIHYDVKTTTGIMTLADLFPTYDWVYDNGRNNIGTWIENAARIAGK